MFRKEPGGGDQMVFLKNSQSKDVRVDDLFKINIEGKPQRNSALTTSFGIRIETDTMPEALESIPKCRSRYRTSRLLLPSIVVCQPLSTTLNHPSAKEKYAQDVKSTLYRPRNLTICCKSREEV